MNTKLKQVIESMHNQEHGLHDSVKARKYSLSNGI